MNKASYRYTCEICSQRFGRQSTLSKHVRMHEAEQPMMTTTVNKRAANTIPCNQCDKLFKTTTTLKKHKNDKHAATTDSIIDGLIPDTPLNTGKGQANGSDDFILIDSSLDDECIDGIGEPVTKPSKRETRNNKKVAEEPTPAEVINDGSNVSTSSMSSRGSDAGDVACLPTEAQETPGDAIGRQYENESTSASIRLSLSASEDDIEEPSLCLNNLFDDNLNKSQDTAQVPEVDQVMPSLAAEEEPVESRDESDSQSVDSVKGPAVLKRKRVSEASESLESEADAQDETAEKTSCKKSRLDDSTSQPQSKSYLGKCIIL